MDLAEGSLLGRVAPLVAALVSLVAMPSADAGQATCSNPGLPVGASASSDLMPGRLTLTLTGGLLPGRSEETLREPTGDILYDASLDLIETRLSVAYAVKSWLAVGLALPYRIVDVDVTYRDPTTGEVLSPEPNTIHARDEQLRGIGDPSLLVHLAREARGVRLHARLGTSLPLGGTVEDPFALGAIGFEHQHIQLGTGTFVPFVAVEAQRAVRRDVTLAVWGLVHASLYENGEGYQAGDRYSGGLTATSNLTTRAFTFSAAAEVHAETAERWHGVVPVDEGNTGRVDVLVGAGAAWRPAPGWAVLADVKLPVLSEVDGNQLDFDVVVGLGVAATFDLKPRPSYRGLDHAVIGAPGSAPALVPVPGKITVFDLWAEWCPPCRELDEALEALARRHPDQLAIRKLDVVDTDTDAWSAYMDPGGFDLPHVKVYGADGALLFERTAPPAELVQAIEALLAE